MSYGSYKKLATEFEMPYKGSNSNSNNFEGWFVAPETTKYKFYLACDDSCSMKLAKTANAGPSSAS
jgi:hypothetical protein